MHADPLTQAAFSDFAVRGPAEATGYTSADIACWVGGPEVFVARGSFAPDQLEQSELGEEGELAATGELLALDRGGDPQRLLDRSEEQRPQVSRLHAAVERHDVISFIGLATGDDPSAPWAATALARSDRWELVLLWAFTDSRRADEGHRFLADILTETDGGRIGDLIEGDPVDLLERDGAVISLRAPLAVDPPDWRRPVIEFDTAFTLGPMSLT